FIKPDTGHNRFTSLISLSFSQSGYKSHTSIPEDTWLELVAGKMMTCCRLNSPAAMSALTASLLLLLLPLLLSVSAQQGSTPPWKTLSGNYPLVVARGGFSGLFPDSSSIAYQFAQQISVPDLILWCDLQLTKDAFGICAPDLKLDNSTDISKVYKSRQGTYTVNGVKQDGWFPSDFTFKELSTVSLTQGVYSRSPNYDTNSFPILTVDDVAGLKPAGLWLNVQHDSFYTQQNLSMRNYVLAASKRVVINYISSPEVGFLTSISTRFNPNITKLFFRFNAENEIEPTLNQTYGSLLKNLTFVRTFASGIIVPKTSIWPVDASNYLRSSSNPVVLDAHKAGLEVFASDFFNDAVLSYNYSYDPVSEYLKFVDNGQFSVDGVLSDYPITPSTAFVKFLVISKNGASGDYPGCTDIAYRTAISDGADVIDCPIQMSVDGVPFCQSSINLIETTKAAETLNNFTTSVPELLGNGIYSFSLPWTQIQNLAPAISNPYPSFQLFRNPKMRNAGKLVSLADFLTLAKENEKSLSGVLIKIENAAYLMEKQGLAVLDAVETELEKAGYGNQTALKVMIQSTNSSVLMKLKDKNKYELVYQVDETIGSAEPSAIAEMKEFADSVLISKTSVFPVNEFFLSGITNVVSRLQSAKLPVYVETFSNEFASQPWDFFADANVELNTYVTGTNITGVVTDFPKTSARFKKNICSGRGDDTPLYMAPVRAGSLLGVIQPPSLPPAQAPSPPLTENDIAEPPLPAVGDKPTTPTPPGAGATPPTPSNGYPKVGDSFTVWSVAMLLFTALFVAL
ncbi:Glycerophosphodiester phosphodiesterase GDPDL3, partial [Linum grandiflorum]